MKNFFFGLIIATVALGAVDTFNTNEAANKQIDKLNVDTAELVNITFTHKAPF